MLLWQWTLLVWRLHARDVPDSWNRWSQNELTWSHKNTENNLLTFLVLNAIVVEEFQRLCIQILDSNNGVVIPGRVPGTPDLPGIYPIIIPGHVPGEVPGQRPVVIPGHIPGQIPGQIPVYPPPPGTPLHTSSLTKNVRRNIMSYLKKWQILFFKTQKSGLCLN